MKKILLTLIYPFYVFLVRTIFGNAFLMLSPMLLTMLVLRILFPSISELRGQEAESVASGMTILTLFAYPFWGMLFMWIGDYLGDNYRKFGYIK